MFLEAKSEHPTSVLVSEDITCFPIKRGQNEAVNIKVKARISQSVAEEQSVKSLRLSAGLQSVQPNTHRRD